MVFSASRRTDIPAFFGEWMLQRLREGKAAARNPFNQRQVTVFQFDSASVDCIVFWTKNPAPFIRYLDEIDALGYRYYFQFTLTAYGRDVERNLDKERLPDTFAALSERIGREKVIWRYDPIFLNDRYSLAFHTEHFEQLLCQLRNYTEKCVVSFIDRCSFLDAAFKELRIRELTDDEMEETARALSGIVRAQAPGLHLAACSEKFNFEKYGIVKNKCVDDELIAKITGRPFAYKKDPSQRNECGCAPSRDLGAYNTCLHNCAYCYAARGAKVQPPGGTDSLLLTGSLDPLPPLTRYYPYAEGNSYPGARPPAGRGRAAL
ncbi:MAG: DUF1848 domain-containing protein [Treponema sp.]|jgi:hypothetical protein|nr:DUF1848 domain-containing protein [Treponema sp.]